MASTDKVRQQPCTRQTSPVPGNTPDHRWMLLSLADAMAGGGAIGSLVPLSLRIEPAFLLDIVRTGNEIGEMNLLYHGNSFLL
ncbi:MAG TPA: hypothetical protein VD978_11160 [Azospirillum sp.]|nr:hypothetical protein [Azospirillum sp.]